MPFEKPLPLVRALLAAWLVIAAAGHAAGQQGTPGFVAGTGDVPLMPGLSESADGPVVFDTPGGRIVESWAFGRLGSDAVRSFYAAALPQLGWRPVAPDAFGRESEVLHLEIRRDGETVAVQFRITPAADS